MKTYFLQTYLTLNIHYSIIVYIYGYFELTSTKTKQFFKKLKSAVFLTFRGFLKDKNRFFNLILQTKRSFPSGLKEIWNVLLLFVSGCSSDELHVNQKRRRNFERILNILLNSHKFQVFWEQKWSDFINQVFDGSFDQTSWFKKTLLSKNLTFYLFWLFFGRLARLHELKL